MDITTSTAIPVPNVVSGAASFPTPHSNGDSNSPGVYVGVGKGKGKAVTNPFEVIRGKVTDAKRITHFMEHQNRQHEDAITHLEHSAKMVESLRFV